MCWSFSLSAAPTVSSLGTSSGTTAGGTVITVTGTNFPDITEVTFGGVDVNSSTQLTVGTPPHTAGVWDVVSTLASSSALPSLDRFTDNVAHLPAPSPSARRPSGRHGEPAMTITIIVDLPESPTGCLHRSHGQRPAVGPPAGASSSAGQTVGWQADAGFPRPCPAVAVWPPPCARQQLERKTLLVSKRGTVTMTSAAQARPGAF